MTSALPWALLARLKPNRFVNSSPRSAFLRSALQTAHYSQRYAQPQQIPAAPPVSAAEVFADFRAFENPSAPRPPAAPLASPWSGSARVAALAPWFPIDCPLVLTEFDPAELSRLAPEALAAPLETLLALATLTLRGRTSLPQLRFGLIAFTGVGRPAPTEADRDLLWRAFQIPAYTQFRGFHGELLASECELHDGLHIDPLADFEMTSQGLAVTSFSNLRFPIPRLLTGFDARIDPAPCPCGRPAPRLTGLVPARRAVRAAAA